MTDDLVLSRAEIERITGGYKRPGDQLRELHHQGYFRARIGKITREVILERAHYDAVCAGAGPAAQQDLHRPRVRPPSLQRVK